MAQSFWSDPEYLKFKTYTERLEATWKSLTADELKAKVSNWKKGVEKMQQLAIGYGMEYVTPRVTFADMANADHINWVKLHKLGGLVIGLWDGPETWIDGKPVVSPQYLDIMASPENITDMDFDHFAEFLTKTLHTFKGEALPV